MAVFLMNSEIMVSYYSTRILKYEALELSSKETKQNWHILSHIVNIYDVQERITRNNSIIISYTIMQYFNKKLNVIKAAVEITHHYLITKRILMLKTFYTLHVSRLIQNIIELNRSCYFRKGLEPICLPFHSFQMPSNAKNDFMRSPSFSNFLSIFTIWENVCQFWLVYFEGSFNGSYFKLDVACYALG